MNIEGKTLLVTGAAGHVGGHIVDLLVQERPAAILALDRAFGDGSLPEPAGNGPIKRIECDITDTSEIRQIMKGVDAVIHTAARLSRDVMADLRQGFEVNIAGTFGLIEASVSAGVKRFVFTSSISVYHGHRSSTPIDESVAYTPESLYGAGKSASEMFLRVFHDAHGLEYAALRCAAIYGIRQSLRSNTARVIPESFARIEKGLPPIIYGDGTAAYDFIDVLDVARAHILAIKSSATSGAYNVATGVSTTIAEAVRLVSDVAGYSGPPEYIDQGNRNRHPTHVFEVAKAEQRLGFRANIPLHEGLTNYHRWRRRLQREGDAVRE